jgi:hypothetical protein
MDSPLASPLQQQGPLVAQTTAAPQQQPAPSYDLSNYNSAVKQMQLNPQEQALYQMHLQNLHGSGGVDNPPDATNPQGSRSSLLQTTFEINGKVYNIPTVWGGKILPPDQALQMAKQYGLEKFPSYSSEQEAEARYQQMHDYMDKDTGAYLQSKK